MAITATRITAADVADTTDQNTYTTPSWTPVVNRLYLMRVRYTCSSGVVPAITDTTGLNWVLIAQQATGAGNWGGIYRGMKPSGLAAGTVKVDATGATPTGCIIQVTEFQGIPTTGTDGADAIGAIATQTSGSGTSAAITITTATASSGIYYTVGIGATVTVTVPSTPGTFTDLSPDLSYSTPSSKVASSFLDNANGGTPGTFSPAATWSGSNSWRAFALEVKAVGSSPPSNTVAPVVSGNLQGGQTLSCTTGTWTGTGGTITYTYQWQRATSTNTGTWGPFANIGAATSSTYVLLTTSNPDVLDKFQCIVTATDSNGATPATSNVVGPVGNAYAPSMNKADVLVCANSMSAVYTRPAVATGAVLGGKRGLNRVFIGLNR